MTWPLLVAGLGGYLLGSIPFGLVLTRLAGLGDIRTMGSGNIGATNVLRTGARGLAVLTLLLDSGKGAVAVLGAANFGPDTALWAGAGAFLGHLYPLWLRFRGGKGVAVALGILLAMDWRLGLATAGVWLVVAALFRISSLSALTAALAVPVMAHFMSDFQVFKLGVFLAVFIFITHRTNIRDLLAGTEERFTDTPDDT